MNIIEANGFDKNNATELPQVRAQLVYLLKQKPATEPVQIELPLGQDAILHRREAPPIATKPSTKAIDLALAAEARCAVGHVQAARRLANSENKELIVAALLGIVPIGTVERGDRPARWGRPVMAANPLFRGPGGKMLGRLLTTPEAEGWAASRTTRNHWRLSGPSGEIVIFASTPSHQTHVDVWHANLRRARRSARQGGCLRRALATRKD